MAQMQRGANVALTREIPGLTRVVLGVAWDAGAERVLDDNLVLAAVLLGSDGRVASDRDFVFFNQVLAAGGSVAERGDLLGAGDREQLEVSLDGVPAGIERIAVVLYVNEGPAQRRTLGQLRSLAVVVRDGDGRELVRSVELASAGPAGGGVGADTAMTLAELYRHGGDWKFRVVGQGYRDGVQRVLDDYGVPR